MIKTKVTLTKLNEYKEKLVTHHNSNDEVLLKHEQLYKMMNDQEILRDRSLWHYFHHYVTDCAQRIAHRNTQWSCRRGELPRRTKKVDYDVGFLSKYFDDDNKEDD